MSIELDGVVDGPPGSRLWPRVYLDSGILLDIADGRLDPELWTRLLASMTTQPKWLVVTLDHMQDVLARTESGSRGRFGVAVERFPFRAVVSREPYEIEPWSGGLRDIQLRPIDRFQDLLVEPAAAPKLAELAAAQDQMHLAASTVQSIRRTSAPLSAKASQFVIRCLVTLQRGWMGTDVPAIVAMWESGNGDVLLDAERQTVIDMLTPWAALLADYDQQYPLSAEDRERLLRTFRDSFDYNSREHSPGMFLAHRLSGCWQRNVTRKPRRSDYVDGMHASYFPYVDVATCDASAFSCLAPYVEMVRGVRYPVIVRNGDFDSLIAAIVSLDSPERTEDAARHSVAAEGAAPRS